jgi:hypothetical protein
VKIDFASPSSGTVLTRGKPIHFNVNVEYNLVSTDAAILALSLSQGPSSNGGCNKAGDFVAAAEAPIQRGLGGMKLTLVWPGDTGEGTGGRVYGTGYLTFVPSFWANVNGNRGARFRLFAPTSEYCYPFGQ